MRRIHATSAASFNFSRLLLQTELHPDSELRLCCGSVSDVRLQGRPVLRGPHPGPVGVRPLLWAGDESQPALHPGGVPHQPEGGLRHTQPGVLRLGHPAGNGEELRTALEVFGIDVSPSRCLPL